MGRLYLPGTTAGPVKMVCTTFLLHRTIWSAVRLSTTPMRRESLPSTEQQSRSPVGKLLAYREPPELSDCSCSGVRGSHLQILLSPNFPTPRMSPHAYAQNLNNLGPSTLGCQFQLLCSHGHCYASPAIKLIKLSVEEGLLSCASDPLMLIECLALF